MWYTILTNWKIKHMIILSHECTFLGSLSRHNKDLEWWSLSPRHVTALGSWTSRVTALRQISVTALFYLEDSRTVHPRSVRACQPKDSKRREWRTVQGGRDREWERERERKRALAPPFICFSSIWACPLQIGLSQECCLFYLKSSLWSSDLPLTFLCSIFEGFSLPCLLATAILDSFSLCYLPNNLNRCRKSLWQNSVPIYN